MAGPVHEPRWIDRLIVEATHFEQIRTFGGLHGLRDEAGLDSALARPRNKRVYGVKADIASLAAAYGYGLCRNHPFNDGNKRIAFVVMAIFTELNGYELTPPEAAVVTQMFGLAAGELTEEDLAEWVRHHLAAALG